MRLYTFFTHLVLIISSITIASCSSGDSKNTPETSSEKSQSGELLISEGETVPLKYADGFTITKYDDISIVTVFDPWSTDTLSTYLLYKGEIDENKVLPKHDMKIKVPVSRVGALSSPHVGYISLIEEQSSIVGASNIAGIYNETVAQIVKEGKIVELGHEMSHNLEEIIGLSPDILIKTGFDNVKQEDARLLEAGVPVVYFTEWMESSMLARAEWMKYVAAFYGKEKMADSLFNTIEKQYIEVSEMADTVSSKPSVLLGADFKGTWHMPGGKSYRAELYKNAGADYYYSNESSKGSLPLSFEIVIEHQLEADYWFGAKAPSLQALIAMEERYGLFSAYKHGNVYHFDKRVNQGGGNDYWESGHCRPDIILKDIVSVLHPHLLPNHELYYYRKLE